MSAQPYVMEASIDYRAPCKDVPKVSGQEPIRDQTHMWGLHSVSTKGSRHYFLPFVDGPVLRNSPYMNVVQDSKNPLTKDTRSLQPSLNHSQRYLVFFNEKFKRFINLWLIWGHMLLKKILLKVDMMFMQIRDITSLVQELLTVNIAWMKMIMLAFFKHKLQIRVGKLQQ